MAYQHIFTKSLNWGNFSHVFFEALEVPQSMEANYKFGMIGGRNFNVSILRCEYTVCIQVFWLYLKYYEHQLNAQLDGFTDGITWLCVLRLVLLWMTFHEDNNCSRIFDFDNKKFKQVLLMKYLRLHPISQTWSNFFRLLNILCRVNWLRILTLKMLCSSQFNFIFRVVLRLID